MTESRLNELIEKSKSEKVSNEEILEVVAATLQSVSRHSKDIKQKLDQLTDLLIEIKQDMSVESSAILLNGWGKIEEEPDQD